MVENTLETTGLDGRVPISIIANKALVFDLLRIKQIREIDNILGVLSGTLPIAPQQSIFLSIPLQLSIEEVLYLISVDHAYLTFDKLLFRQLFEVFSTEDKDRYLREQWKQHVHYVKAKKLEIEQKRLVMIAQAKAKKLKKNKAKNDKNMSANDENNQTFNSNDPNDSQTLNSNDPNDSQELTVSELGLIFHEIENNSLKFPNYQWLVDNTQKHPDIQKLILFSYLRNYLINNLNDTVFPPSSCETPDSFDTISNSVRLDNAEFNYKIFQNRLQQLKISLKFIYSLRQNKSTSNYFVSPGLKFGSKFIVYPGDPLRYHSHLIVNFYDYHSEALDLMSIVNGGRLAVGVKKLWVISGVTSIMPSKPKKQGDQKQAIQEINDFVSQLTSNYTQDAASEVVNFSIEWAGFG